MPVAVVAPQFYLAQGEAEVLAAALAALKMTLVTDLMALPIAAVAVAVGLMFLQPQAMAVLALWGMLLGLRWGLIRGIIRNL